jgi:hypothetical protein
MPSQWHTALFSRLKHEIAASETLPAIESIDSSNMLSQQYNRTFDRLEHQIAASETNKRHREHQLGNMVSQWELFAQLP